MMPHASGSTAPARASGGEGSIVLWKVHSSEGEHVARVSPRLRRVRPLRHFFAMKTPCSRRAAQKTAPNNRSSPSRQRCGTAGNSRTRDRPATRSLDCGEVLRVSAAHVIS